MATISANQVQDLRKATGAGLMACKKALVQTDGDVQKALVVLKEQGLAAVNKKAGRLANEGTIACYTHNTGKVAGLVILACETDFVAKNEEFKELAHNIAMQVVALHPDYLSPETIPTDVLAEQKALITKELAKSDKPQDIIDKITAGKLAKFASEHCLTQQKYFKDDSVDIATLIAQHVQKFGENIQIIDFKYFRIGD